MKSDPEERQLRREPDPIVGALRLQMIDHALPLWAGQGWDPQVGGFVEKLHIGGEPDSAAPRRVRVQARQIYCFAKAADLGWYPPGRAIALRGLEYLLAKAKSPDGRPGFVHLLNSDGSVRDALRDSYDHAFVVLALATVYKLGGDAQVRAELDSLMEFVERDLRSPHGGFLEGVPAATPRRQNPHMHLLEAMIATFDATGDPVFQRRAGELFDLFLAKFYDPQRRVISEYFRDDWSTIEPVCVEPGHLAEWVWLLKGFERITDVSTHRYRSELIESALRYCDEGTGCLIDEGDADGSPTKATRRLWPQTEIAKAWIAQAEAGEEGAAGQAHEALSRLHRHYLSHPVQGGWYDQFDEQHLSVVASIPASSFYHILCAVAEADRVLG